MSHKRVYRPRQQTSDEVAREHAIRQEFAHHPTLEELIATGKYSEPMQQGTYLDMLQLMAHFRTLREQNNWSLSELAERSGIDKASLCRLESGNSQNPTVLTLERVARSLGKSIRFVLEDEELASDRPRQSP